jgi:Tfp pilus assembly protein PilO
MKNLSRDSIVMLAVAAVMVAVAVVAVYMPQGRQLDQIKAQIAQKEASIQDDALKVAVVPAMTREAQSLETRYKDFGRKLPHQKDLHEFLLEIDASVRHENLKNSLTEPGKPSREELFNTLPIIMKFKGDYLALGRFLRELEGMERLTRVQKLLIASDGSGGDLNIEVQLNIYFTES